MGAKFKIGDEVKIANHPEKKMNGRTVIVKNVGYGRFNPDSGIEDQNVYHVFDGNKSLGWAPECDLELLNKPS